MTSTRLCQYEGDSYPSDQFRLDATHGWVHDVDPLHTVDGDILPVWFSNDPGFDSAFPDDLDDR
jgi:hypothetical protein